ncbi:MAG: acetyltransferase [Leptolyngbyaceae cyanobacterium bins.59]|nr:acetyltransferase [Leptolyngbyaceae cyanobacterium bins.59]
MLLKDKTTDTLVEILDITALINPVEANVTAQDQAGQEEQNPQSYLKQQLQFPSGEALPRCWVDAEYQSAL